MRYWKCQQSKGRERWKLPIEVSKSPGSRGKAGRPRSVFTKEVAEAVGEIEAIYRREVSQEHAGWFAVKLFERDSKIQEQLTISNKAKSDIESWIVHCEKQKDNDAESIITKERYRYISNIIQDCFKRKQTGVNLSDRINQIVTNPWLGIPIDLVSGGCISLLFRGWDR